MRRLLPLAFLLVACAKPTEAPAPPAPNPTAKIAPADVTPEGMAKAMDVPMYPGAEAPDGMSKLPAQRTDGGTSYSMALATKDPVAKVGSWYAKELGQAAMPSKGGVMIVGNTKKGNQAMVNIGPEAGRTVIRIKSIAYKK